MSQPVRRRYLALRIVSGHPLNEREVMSAIWDATLRIFGEYGVSRAGPTLIEYDPQKNRAIVRCSHLVLDMVRAAIASITEVNGKTSTFHVLGVSGTLRALRKKALF
ncbi:MAG: Ribonuclease P protein component 2 [Candidatus Bathyarchaeota archaeon BA1]|nr:MAG: Ribonuclease P protein component 2 [Candidatus Bathyarchaeota archaeon BA1]